MLLSCCCRPRLLHSLVHQVSQSPRIAFWLWDLKEDGSMLLGTSYCFHLNVHLPRGLFGFQQSGPAHHIGPWRAPPSSVGSADCKTLGQQLQGMLPTACGWKQLKRNEMMKAKVMKVMFVVKSRTRNDSCMGLAGSSACPQCPMWPLKPEHWHEKCCFWGSLHLCWWFAKNAKCWVEPSCAVCCYWRMMKVIVML